MTIFLFNGQAFNQNLEKSGLVDFLRLAPFWVELQSLKCFRPNEGLSDHLDSVGHQQLDLFQKD